MSNNYARENNADEAKISVSVIFAEGAFKNVYKGKYTKGARAGQEAVCKIFKSGSVYEASYFDVELKVVDKALEVVNGFNNVKIINKKIWLNKPTIWTFLPGSSRSGEKAMVEPMIANFEKFNSNTGWTPKKSSPWTEVMQALSHFSYHSTNRSLLFCDLQGGVYQDGFIITDPVIMSASEEYGPTDLGPKGLSTFFANHTCNKYCDLKWMVPHDVKAYFTVQSGTSMALPTRRSRAPLTHQLSRLVEDLSINEEE